MPISSRDLSTATDTTTLRPAGFRRAGSGYARFLSVTVALCTWLFSWAGTTAFGQISPGELSIAHQSIDGITHCTRCHPLRGGSPPEKCLDCHANIRLRLEQKRGLHDSTVRGEGKLCPDCHREHAGRDAELIQWPAGRDRFNHTATGYALAGKHARLSCRECHKPALIQENLRELDPEIDITRTMLGLPQSCLGCHTDEHRRQLGPNCLNCHDQEAWTPAPVFDHARAAFPLTGAHRSVECTKCHPRSVDPKPVQPDGPSFTRYVALDFDHCTSCHKDRHENRLGQNCRRCHTTTGWRQITQAEFDHDKTQYPLRGRHAQVACDGCHKAESRMVSLAFEICSDCHSDAHQGQFRQRSDGGPCESCHGVEGFVPASFTIEDHRQTRFALEGAHLAQPCFACHTLVESDTDKPYRRFVLDERQCESCHQDGHRNQFGSSEPVKTCTDCHFQSTWSLPDFDHQHLTSYPLIGAHGKVACAGCHTPAADTADVVRYRPLKTGCESCHAKDQTLAPLE